MDDEEVTETTARWFQRFVVDLKLCPFALQLTPRIAVYNSDSEQLLLSALADEIDWLRGHGDEETALLVHPRVLGDFLDYNDFLGLCDDFLKDQDLDGEFQIASFHPEYQFSGTRADDAENYANRSPYPMLHILRESSVSDAVCNHPDTERIPERNIEVLNALGTPHLRELWSSCFAND